MTELKAVSLDDKYEQQNGRVLINGTQALVRLPLIQKERDRQAGLHTAGYISGYRGSPLGNYDANLWREQKRLDVAGIVFQPGVNEDLAATAVWGTQQLDGVPKPKYDGVFAIWYGKGPGVDRSGDVFKHGNYAGSHKDGGVLVVCGDDHPGKSSSISHQSEQALAANHIPMLYPSSVQEYIDYGLLGLALSRYSGLWVGFKTVNETVEQTATVDIDFDKLNIVYPDSEDIADDVIGYRPGYRPALLVEMDVKRKRLPLAERFIRANGLNRTEYGHGAELGIVCAGKSYQDVLQALSLLGIDRERAAVLGLDIFKVGCIWPLESEGITEFAQAKKELLFVEEKSAFLEPQAASILYQQPERPRIIGKRDESGQELLPADIQLNPIDIALLIVSRLEAMSRGDEALNEAVASLKATEACSNRQVGNAAIRMPFFCSGCPHNISTKVPEGSMAMAGIGCHGMASFSRKDTMIPVHMGGEGVNWTGLQHFTETEHVFQNLGDGTYFHSGLLAIRAAVAAKSNITYKILYNDAVAMTGGQPIDGPISVAEIAHQVLHEGVVRCVLLSDNPSAYQSDSGLPAGIKVYYRDELDTVQRELRETRGCTVLIYEQTCAAEKRRRRKRGDHPNPAKRMFIYDEVCEGCGDCSVQSTCVSLQPKETAQGTKRRIDQSSCNKDYSCNKGFCPSFVTVLDAEPRKPQGATLDRKWFAELPEPQLAAINHQNYGIMITGIGGTGVITVGALLGMAAHLEGKACSIFDMTGLSQKNGAVYSHLRIANSPEAIRSQRLGAGEADLLLGFDLVAALGADAVHTLAKTRTRIVGNADVAPTVDFQFNPDDRLDVPALQGQLRERVSDGAANFIDASGLALKLMGDTIGANLFMVGYALQRGLLPLSVVAIEKAIELNGVAVDFNLTALNLGRLWSVAPQRLEALLPAQVNVFDPQEAAIDTVIERGVTKLTSYQDVEYARRYRQCVERVQDADSGAYQLTRTVAEQLLRLMAYKDEYEVARLYSDPGFMEQLREEFESGFRLQFNLAPPLISSRDAKTGQPRKMQFGPWMLTASRWLAKLRRLRGTRLDIFGYSAERRTERALIDEYEFILDELLSGLTPENHELACKIAELPSGIRGYGHVKERNLAAFRTRLDELLDVWRRGESREQASKSVTVIPAIHV